MGGRADGQRGGPPVGRRQLVGRPEQGAGLVEGGGGFGGAAGEEQRHGPLDDRGSALPAAASGWSSQARSSACSRWPRSYRSTWASPRPAGPIPARSPRRRRGPCLPSIEPGRPVAGRRSRYAMIGIAAKNSPCALLAAPVVRRSRGLVHGPPRSALGPRPRPPWSCWPAPRPAAGRRPGWTCLGWCSRRSWSACAELAAIAQSRRAGCGGVAAAGAVSTRSGPCGGCTPASGTRPGSSRWRRRWRTSSARAGGWPADRPGVAAAERAERNEELLRAADALRLAVQRPRVRQVGEHHLQGALGRRRSPTDRDDAAGRGCRACSHRRA